ncbi:hypothetical protein RhiJN_07047 [Ceratobasidium sp. AG-Ba]|nr:hypothetical protein RhiJN_07047 [Ceratobasidium sp. AG-Ba]
MNYYQAGIGTEGAIATGLGTHVRGGYDLLMRNYTEGDRFRYSDFPEERIRLVRRPAYFIRSAFFPHIIMSKSSLRTTCSKKDDEEGRKMSNGFKRAFSIDVKIDFVGVFDTVNSVGIIPRELPFAKSNYLIHVFLHAVAVDERRAKFKPNLWGRATEQEEKLGEVGKHGKYHKPQTQGSSSIWDYIPGGKDKNTDRGRVQKGASGDSAIHRNGHDFGSPDDRKNQTDVKEVWFSGAHCDVGGGSPVVKVPTTPEPKLVDVDDDSAHHEGGHPNDATDTTAVNIPLPGPSKLVPDEKIKLGTTEDEKDAVQPIYDQLLLKWTWWILELLPMKQRYQRHDGSWRA